jgi:hypothetical protein
MKAQTGPKAPSMKLLTMLLPTKHFLLFHLSLAMMWALHLPLLLPLLTAWLVIKALAKEATPVQLWMVLPLFILMATRRTMAPTQAA